MHSFRSQKILYICVAVSLAVHAICLVLFQKHSLWVSTQPVNNKGPWALSQEEVLREVFAPLHPAIAKEHAPRQESTSLQCVREQIFVSTPYSYPAPNSDSLLAKVCLSIPEASQPQLCNFLADMPKELYLPAVPLPLPLPLPAEELCAHQFNAAPPIPNPPSPPPLHRSQNLMGMLAKGVGLERLAEERVAHISRLPSLAELATRNLSDSFETELTFLPTPVGSGYMFALTLLPKEELDLPKLRQRVTFLLDRANSIQQERFAASKQAILRALEEFDLEDGFNIIVFDNKVEKLFASFTSPTPDALFKAEAFLDKISLGSFFSTSDLYKPLLQAIPGRVEPDEIHCAILLTDGDNFAKKAGQQELLTHWTSQNQGKVALYAVTMEYDANAASLGNLCQLNRGALIQSTTSRGLKRQVLKLAKTLSTPLAKNVSLKAIGGSHNFPIELYPRRDLAPHLFQNQPYVILGTTETLDDFIFFAQGRLKGAWANIKKQVSFLDAKKGGRALQAAYSDLKKLESPR